MSGANADKIEFTFQDVAAYFSEEEWKLLHQWQKELYRNVMKEIQQALISLGPLIAKSVFSLRAEGTDLFGVDGKDLERTHTSNKSTSGKIANSDVVLAVNCDENHYLTDSPNNVVNRSNNSSPSGFASANSVSDVKTNQDLNVNFINDLDVKGRDRRTGLCAEDAGITQIVSIEIKEETDTYFLRHQDFDKIEHQTGEGIRNRKTPFARSLAHPETTATYRGSSKEANVKITKSIEKGNAGCQSSLGNNRALGRPNITQCEHASTHPEQFYQRNVIAEQSDTYYDFETNLLIPNLSTFPPNMQKNIRPYVCTECNKSFKTKQERTRHQRTHTGERPYHCTECKKSFSLRHHLIGHQRTHTGEKPYQCTKCKKRFSLNGNLNKHQRRHLVNGLIPLED